MLRNHQCCPHQEIPPCHQHNDWQLSHSKGTLLSVIDSLNCPLFHRRSSSSTLTTSRARSHGWAPVASWGNSRHQAWLRGCHCSASFCAESLGKVSAVPGSLSEKTRKESFTLDPGKPVYFHCILILRDCLPRPRLSHGKEKPGSVTRGETCPPAKFLCT